MYKVFIDHIPVIFGQKSEISSELPSLLAAHVKSVKKDIRPHLADCHLDRPLQIECEDVDEDFERIFSKYKRILAAGGLVKRKSSYLMIKRNGLWDIPKGKVDKGEDIPAAAVREVMEECGIRGHQIIKPMLVTFHVYRDKGKPALKETHWFLMEYHGRKSTFPQTNEGITKVKWMLEEHMLSKRGRTYGSINEVLDTFVHMRDERTLKKEKHEHND